MVVIQEKLAGYQLLKKALDEAVGDDRNNNQTDPSQWYVQTLCGNIDAFLSGFCQSRAITVFDTLKHFAFILKQERFEDTVDDEEEDRDNHLWRQSSRL